MSMTSSLTGTAFEAGFFLVDDEACLRETTTVSANHSQRVTRDGRSIVPMGAVIPNNDSTAKGILYEDIDVTDGDVAGSIVTRGVIYGDRLPEALDGTATAVLTGIKVNEAAPAVVRPAIFGKLASLTVVSEAGTATGDTKITVTGYVIKGGESLVYKVATVATTVKVGEDLGDWTALTNGADVTAATGEVITVAVKDKYGKAVAAGSATVTARA